MKIIFSGTSSFALPTLNALLKSDHQICAVYTKIDRKAGRGQQLSASPVKELALQQQLLLRQPPTLKDPAVQQEMRELQPDLLVDVAYGLLIPPAILELPRWGCINLHPSLLPRWRGAAPIQRAIEAGDSTTGITVMQMDEGFDTGGIYKQIEIPITAEETTESLWHKTAELGAHLMLEVIAELEQGHALLIPQDDQQSCYANKLTKEEGKIDWQRAATSLDWMVRAFNPWPIAYTTLHGQPLRIWQAKPENSGNHSSAPLPTPGTILQNDRTGIVVATGAGALRLLQLQLPGGKVLTAGELFNAHRDKFAVGQQLG